jgi:hypothetical protein
MGRVREMGMAEAEFKSLVLRKTTLGRADGVCLKLPELILP